MLLRKEQQRRRGAVWGAAMELKGKEEHCDGNGMAQFKAYNRSGKVELDSAQHGQGVAECAKAQGNHEWRRLG